MSKWHYGSTHHPCIDSMSSFFHPNHISSTRYTFYPSPSFLRITLPFEPHNPDCLRGNILWVIGMGGPHMMKNFPHVQNLCTHVGSNNEGSEGVNSDRMVIIATRTPSTYQPLTKRGGQQKNCQCFKSW
jgi:hypothetical protein